MSAVSAAINTMPIENLKRSYFAQRKEIAMLERRLESMDVTAHPQEEIDRLFRDTMVMQSNLDQTIDQIKALQGGKLF